MKSGTGGRGKTEKGSNKTPATARAGDLKNLGKKGTKKTSSINFNKAQPQEPDNGRFTPLRWVKKGKRGEKGGNRPRRRDSGVKH